MAYTTSTTTTVVNVGPQGIQVLTGGTQVYTSGTGLSSNTTQVRGGFSLPGSGVVSISSNSTQIRIEGQNPVVIHTNIQNHAHTPTVTQTVQYGTTGIPVTYQHRPNHEVTLNIQPPPPMLQSNPLLAPMPESWGTPSTQATELVTFGMQTYYGQTHKHSYQ